MINIQIFFLLNIIVTQIFCDLAPAADPDTFVVAKLPGCHSFIRYTSLFIQFYFSENVKVDEAGNIVVGEAGAAGDQAVDSKLIDAKVLNAPT